ncbi:MAG: hypothetical protein ACI8RZ_002318 [Myxococcota bacterium]|jgi:hypothetical protein
MRALPEVSRLRRPLERALNARSAAPSNERHEQPVGRTVMRSGQKKHGSEDGEPQLMGEGAPFGIESPEAESAPG